MGHNQCLGDNTGLLLKGSSFIGTEEADHSFFPKASLEYPQYTSVMPTAVGKAAITENSSASL